MHGAVIISLARSRPPLYQSAIDLNFMEALMLPEHLNWRRWRQQPSMCAGAVYIRPGVVKKRTARRRERFIIIQRTPSQPPPPSSLG